MIAGLRYLEHADGTRTLQAWEVELAGIDEDGVAHSTGRGWWADVPVIAHGNWELGPDGIERITEDPKPPEPPGT